MTDEEVGRSLQEQLAALVRNPIVVTLNRPLGASEWQWKQALAKFGLKELNGRPWPQEKD